MSYSDQFELINNTVKLLDNFIFDDSPLNYVKLDSSILDHNDYEHNDYEHNDHDLSILKILDLDPNDYSIRDIICSVTKLIRKDNFNLGQYLHKTNDINISYPVGYLIFDYCLAALYGSKVDASLYASHIFHLFHLDKNWNILLQSIILSKLTDDDDVRKFLLILGVFVKPPSADLYIPYYPPEYANMMEQFKKDASLLGTW